MAELMFECPSCKKSISTGIEMAAESFANFDLGSDMTCPHCGVMHAAKSVWTWLRGEPQIDPD